MSDDDLQLTEDDIADLNRATIARSAAFLRLGGAVITVVGVIGIVAWAWYEIRLQQNVTGSALDFNATSASVTRPDFAERIDLLAGSLSSLLLAAVAFGVGLAGRHLSDYTQATTGSSLTGFSVGDRLDGDDENGADDI